jgi:hypothetical protein
MNALRENHQMNFKQSNVHSVGAALLLLFGTSLLSPGCITCSAQVGLAIGQTDMIRQAREVDRYLNEYGKTHDHFPQGTTEFDDVLKSCYKRVGNSAADATVVPQSTGKYRTYYNLAIAVDPSFMSVPVVNGQPQLFDSWNGPPGSVIIVTDGAKNAACWVAGGDGKPAVDPGNTTAYLFFRQTIQPKSSAAPDSD